MTLAWSDIVPVKGCETLERAVREASTDAQEGEMILLSPGCASFDQFQNFEERGKQFTGIVNDLVKEGAK